MNITCAQSNGVVLKCIKWVQVLCSSKHDAILCHDAHLTFADSLRPSQMEPLLGRRAPQRPEEACDRCQHSDGAPAKFTACNKLGCRGVP